MVSKSSTKYRIQGSNKRRSGHLNIVENQRFNLPNWLSVKEDCFRDMIEIGLRVHKTLTMINKKEMDLFTIRMERGEPIATRKYEGIGAWVTSSFFRECLTTFTRVR